MSSPPAWDGTSKGSAAGNWVFIQLVSRFGLLPAYFLLAVVSLYYALFDKKSADAIRALRDHLKLKT